VPLSGVFYHQPIFVMLLPKILLTTGLPVKLFFPVNKYPV
jgi:hypothetical protein